VTFDEAQGAIEASKQACTIMRELSEACCALDCSFRSIFDDEEVADKAAAIVESFKQFQAHVASFDATLADEDDEIAKEFAAWESELSAAE
jgi:hypothetical protein